MVQNLPTAILEKQFRLKMVLQSFPQTKQLFSWEGSDCDKNGRLMKFRSKMEVYLRAPKNMVPRYFLFKATTGTKWSS
jgi:hypothetical protein